VGSRHNGDAPNSVLIYGAGEKPHSDAGPGASLSLWDNYVIFIFFGVSFRLVWFVSVCVVVVVLTHAGERAL